MKLLQSIGPNPHVVRLFLAEKGIEVEREEVDLLKGENRQPAYLARNPAGQLPALELDNGTVLSEITAICEYFEELHPQPPLIGSDAEERAQTRMWVRRIDHGYVECAANGFRYSEGLQLFENRMRCLPEAAEGLKLKAREYLQWLDGQLGEGPWICGARYTLADILLYCFTTFSSTVGQPVDEALSNLGAWKERMDAREAVQQEATS